MMRVLRFAIVALVAIIVSGLAVAQQGASTTLPDPAMTAPREDSASEGLKTGKAQADLAHSIAVFLTDFINRYRLDHDTEEALKAQLPQVAKTLRESGAAGMLLEARFAVETPAVICGDNCGPANMTQRLLGGSLGIVGQGTNPTDVATLALDEEKRNGALKPGAPRRDETERPEATRNYWVTLDGNQIPSFKEINHKDLYSVAYLKGSDKALVEQLRRLSYQRALSDMVNSLKSNADKDELRLAAEDLLKAREKSERDMQAVNERLSEALEAAKKANSDADKIALVAALAGTASTYLSNNQSKSAGKQASPATIELLKQRVQIETNLKTNETTIRSEAQKKNFTIWLNKPD